MKCSVFIATSLDGFIAKLDGNVDWLHTSGKQDAQMGPNSDMGWSDYIKSVDCMIMGRKCMDMINSMNLTEQEWPYGNIKIMVLSNTIKEVPTGLQGKIEMYSGELNALINTLEKAGHQHAYIDGGTSIQGFLNIQLINEMTITRVPILLGEGISLFGKTQQDILLHNCSATAFANDYIQETFEVKYKSGIEDK